MNFRLASFQAAGPLRGANRARGFTIIELIAVMMIVGALAVFVVPRLNPSGFERYAFRHELLSALRYAQKTAMASGCEVEVNLNGGADSYALFYRAGGTATDCGAGGFTDPLQHPAGSGGYAGTAGSGANLGTTGLVRFDGFGNHISGPAVITLAGGPDIRIDGVTGYVRD